MPRHRKVCFEFCGLLCIESDETSYQTCILSSLKSLFPFHVYCEVSSNRFAHAILNKLTVMCCNILQRGHVLQHTATRSRLSRLFSFVSLFCWSRSVHCVSLVCVSFVCLFCIGLVYFIVCLFCVSFLCGSFVCPFRVSLSCVSFVCLFRVSVLCVSFVCLFCVFLCVSLLCVCSVGLV